MAKIVKPIKLSVLSWNIDGLDERELDIRTLSVCDIINERLPEIVMLQEVVDGSSQIIKSLCQQNYKYATCSKRSEYYNAMLYKKDNNLKVEKVLEWRDFENTAMGRHLLSQEITFHNQVFTIMTTHLESLKDYSPQRKDQLQDCFSKMLGKSENQCVIFGGDLNLREPEINAIGGIPEKIKDSWIESGMAKDKKFTWDLKLNDNKSFENNFKPTTRYDRIYFRSPDNKNLECVQFDLVGTKKIDACKLFPSDHFGIFASYRLDVS